MVSPAPSREGTAQGAQRFWLPRSLTARLVAGVLVIVLGLMAISGVATYLLLRSSLVNRLDQQLADITRTFPFSDFQQTPPNQPFRGPQSVWAVELNASNASSAGYFRTAEPLQLSASDARRLVADRSSLITTVTTTGGLILRVRTTVNQYGPLDNPTVQVPGRLVVGLSLLEVQHTLNRLVLLEVLVGASGAVIASAAGWWIVRLGLRPLHDVTRTAQEVADELRSEGTGLQRRVPEQNRVTEVGQLSDSMNTLLAEAETQFAAQLASEARMRQFLADASHELRTPLTSIRGFAELARMQRRLSGEPQSDEPDNLDRIEAEGTRMSRLVEDLLLLARGDQGRPPPAAEVYIADVLDDVTAGARASYPGRTIDYQAQENLVVLGDHDQLLRVIRNLVTNSAVHTRGSIYLTAYAEGDSVVIRVRDEGPGLPPELAAKVFERFWRADKSRARVRGGSGLGMSIVASLVTAHGGSVDFSSTVDHGSLVTVRLPAA